MKSSNGCGFILVKDSRPIECICLFHKDDHFFVRIEIWEITTLPMEIFQFDSIEDAAEEFGDQVFASYMLVHDDLRKGLNLRDESIAKARALWS